MYMVGNMKKMNDLRLEPLDGHDHIESLSKGENSTYFMWGRGKWQVCTFYRKSIE